jgi:hypothetical protein
MKLATRATVRKMVLVNLHRGMPTADRRNAK